MLFPDDHNSGGHTVLVIDDEPLLLALVTEHFLSLGYKVHAAMETEEAQALLANYDYSLIITDLALTQLGFRGLEILDHISFLSTRPKVIVVTGHALPELRVEATNRGIDAYLQKPVCLRDLSNVAAQLIGACS